NVEGFLEGGKGNLFLAITFFSSFLVFAYHIFVKYKNIFFKKSFFVFLIFQVYFFLKVFYEGSVKLEFLLKYFIGTSVGVLFSYVLGVFFSFNIQFLVSSVRNSLIYGYIS